MHPIYRKNYRRNLMESKMEKENNNKQLHKIKLTPTSISDSKKNIYIFFHICCINNYVEVTNEIIDELINSGLYNQCKKIFYSMIKFPSDSLKKKLTSLPKFELIYLNNDMKDVEYPILIYLENFCKENDCYVLYLHTKGVSLPHDEFRQNWRKRLLEKVVKENKICVSLLNEGCDIVGCGWKEKANGLTVEYCASQYSHYSGNFWWANSQYIKKLPSLENIKESHISHKKKDFLTYRTQCEFWIGMHKEINIGINGELNKEYSNKKYYQEKPIASQLNNNIQTQI